MQKYCWILLFSLLTITGELHAQARQKPKLEAPIGAAIQKDNYYPRVKMETSEGDIVVELNRAKAPLTTNNFLTYVKQGEYDNTLFHRIIVDYIVQGGGYDPEYKDKKENFKIINESGNGLKNEMYSVAMARMGDPHSAKRQFFFNMGENKNLDPGRRWGYAVFGMVMEGHEVLDKISAVETHTHPELGFIDAPIENIILKRVSILPDPNFE
ncbi:peptidylprolyl isomerase [Glaciecola petra]|uniref:Peptidyl-prolyl cis-trans isomerase n=1 Tax=Glaciecola petra TaxID=3075602 RepID=A0ABU2ZM08_9ALTE|nr:peptidylprolyl isomerase [Aestuariibacter sp. P117]MDT0593379.1 peptidylprolyl isomerase [Aestuariibacter sp. P117]